MKKNIEVVFTSSFLNLKETVGNLDNTHLKIKYPPKDLVDKFGIIDPIWRRDTLVSALKDPENNFIWGAKGGYGCSEILPMLPWEELLELSPKLFMGFSDCSALISALKAKLNWPAIHGPMVLSSLYDADCPKVAALLSSTAQSISGSLSLEPLGPLSLDISGELFGGCLSVLTNLIGTPYLPNSFEGGVLFFEDIHEIPQKILRNWHQWIQAGIFSHVSGIILGDFGPAPENEELKPILASLAGVPCFSSREIGHIRSQVPIGVGASCRIQRGVELSWNF